MSFLGQSSGSTTTNTKQVSQEDPYGPARGLLDSLLAKTGGVSSDLTGAESSALNSLLGGANAGNPFAPSITGVTNTLLGGGGPDRTGMASDAYTQYQKLINPTAQGDYLDPAKNPFYAQMTNTIGNDVQNRISAMYAGSGRDPSGAGNYIPNLARGVAEGTAPVFANMYSNERDRQLAAINSQYGAGNTTTGLLSNLDQTKLGNQVTGVSATDSALAAQNYGPMQTLAIEAQRRGIPLQTLAAQMGITLPSAQAFGKTTGTGTGTSNTTSQASLADTFYKLATGISSFFPKSK